MAVSKDFRVKKGLVVGQNIDATSGNLSAVEGRFTTSLSAASLSAVLFAPVDITATGSVSSPSISADNIWGNIKDVTYSDLTLSGTTSATNLSAESLSAINIYGNITDVTYSDLTIAGTTSASTIMLDSGKTVNDSDEWETGGVTLQSSFANIGNGGTLAIFTVPMTKYRSGKILIQAVAAGVGTNPSNEYAELTELSFIHNGSTVNMVEYAPVGIGSTTLATYTAEVDSTNVVIKATASSPNENTVQFISTITLLHTTQV
jgi:hypothetical protein